MRILFLAHAFNSLTQRLYVELTALGHRVSVEYDINDTVTEEAAALFRPHLILAPYLRRAIPESVWRKHLCLIVHPGIIGDRGASALDWAIMKGVEEWGVTVLQAETQLDAGPVWAAETFPMREAKKSSLYRNEVTEAAVRAVRAALDRLADYRCGRWQPKPVSLRPMHARLSQNDRAIDWSRDGTASVLRKMHAADSFPGVADVLFDRPCHLYDARTYAASGMPGAILGRAGNGIVRATADGAVWIGQARRLGGEPGIKLPAAIAFPETAELQVMAEASEDIRYEEMDEVGILHFDFYNGAMGTQACQRLVAAYEAARLRPTKVIMLTGGADFFGNGLDLNRIEAADSPADESWRNIHAMDDLCKAIIETDSHLTVSAMQGNTGAGGAFLALAADQVWARDGVILNPHYKNMGNLFGSEYWTYLLPRRVGEACARKIMDHRLPMGVAEAKELGFIDDHFGYDAKEFLQQAGARAAGLAAAADFTKRLAAKRARRLADEVVKPLANYRAEELARMHRNFFGFDPSYHVARYHFVGKTPHSWTPRHLGQHRDLGWRVPEEDTV